jgi:hypothetical protein
MPKLTRETELPKPAAVPPDWAKIAESGKVWDFIEGEDFTGKVSSYRARLRTAARKSGVDFDSREVQKNGRTILKLKAFRLTEKPLRPVKSQSAGEPEPAQKPELDVGQTQLELASIDAGSDRAA